jgi:hypothetical protein
LLYPEVQRFEMRKPRLSSAGAFLWFTLYSLRSSHYALFPCFFEVEGGGVDAVELAGGVGAVGEDMTEVAAALGTGNFDATHAEGAVVMEVDGVFGEGLEETGPAGSGLELGVGFEEGSVAGGAVVEAVGVVIDEGAGEGAFGALLAEDVILLGGELLAPLGIGFGGFGVGLVEVFLDRGVAEWTAGGDAGHGVLLEELDAPEREGGSGSSKSATQGWTRLRRLFRIARNGREGKKK